MDVSTEVVFVLNAGGDEGDEARRSRCSLGLGHRSFRFDSSEVAINWVATCARIYWAIG